MRRRPATPYVVAVALFVAMFSATGAAAPYLPLYYESLGLSLSAIGLLAAVAALTGLIAAPFWGMVADQVLGPRSVLLVASLATAGCALGMALATQAAVVALMAVLLVVAFAGIGPVLDAYALEQVVDNRHRYARLRVWGSIAFVVSSVAAGIAIGQTSIRALFVVLIGSLIAVSAISLLVRPRAPVRVHHRLTGLRTVVRSRPIMSFVAAALVVWSASTMVNGFLSIYLRSLDAPAALVGGSWALGAVVEIPLMIAFPWLAAKLGLRALVVAGAGLLLLRTIVLLLTGDPLLVSLSMALHGAGFALMLVGGVTYVAAQARAEVAATAQGVLSGVVFGLAQAVGPGIGGLIAGVADLRAMFFVAAITSAAGLVALYGTVWGARPPSDADVISPGRSAADMGH